MNVSEDVVLEILSRLPINKAHKIQTLSKYYFEASHTSYFKELVAQRRPGIDGFLFKTIGFNSLSFVSPLPNPFPPLDLSLSFLPGSNVTIWSVAPNGILLCESRHPYRRRNFYTICKLSTKQWKGLPIPRTRYFTKNMAMFILCSNPLHFKIFRLSQDQIPSKRPLPHSYTICELFDSKTWRWKLLDDIKNLDSISHYPAVFASGSAHWEMGYGISIFAFDFYSETWSIIDKPKLRNNWDAELVEYGGKLGIMLSNEKPECSTELWAMENYSQKIWIKKREFLGEMPMTLYGSEVTMTWKKCNKVVFSNLVTGKCYEKELEQRYWGQPMVFPFFSDFESWNFYPPMRAIKPKIMIKLILKRLLAIQKKVHVLMSFYFYFVYYNYYLCTVLLELINYALS